MTDIAITCERLLIASVFLMAGWMKLREGGAFLDTVKNFRLLPGDFAKPFAKLLPWLEFTLGSLLFAGLYVKPASLVLLCLCAIFIVATLYAMRNNLNLTCNCFGLLYRERIGLPTLVRDLLLILCCASVAVLDRGRFELYRDPTRVSDAMAIGMLLITVGVLIFSVSFAYRQSRGFFLALPPRWRGSVIRALRAYYEVSWFRARGRDPNVGRG